MSKDNNNITYSNPPYRKLRGYAFDPSTSLDMDTAAVNQIIYKVPWERNLLPGPEGEYIKVIDRDPASDAFYVPVDLNDPAILASDGLTPSETNPQFHQQMVYAVIMYTIKNFERALGRKVLWSPVMKIVNKKYQREFVEKLVVYPHAVRDQNAYYSPERKALLFGYYNANPANAGLFMPGGIVCSCLSHDIIAHETTHALLDGMYSRYMEVTHPDVAGFHEGFSDIVALLQHFTYPEIVKNQIRLVKGQLDTENILAKLAVEFGQSTGDYHSLRDGIGSTDEFNRWQRREPQITDYETNLECHDRGALLVAAVFDAFIAIYKKRTADLVRLATGGTGIVPAGEIHPDLVNRLAEEATKIAAHVLTMCVRALDYCPPVDINYGDYLRALITADKELVSNDEHHYRLAFINAFRKRGIFPESVPNLSVDTLCYSSMENEGAKAGMSDSIGEFLREFKNNLAYKTNRREIFEETNNFISGDDEAGEPGFYKILFDGNRKMDAKKFEDLTGLMFSKDYKELGISPSKALGSEFPSIELQSLRIMNKTGPGGNIQNQIIMTLIQSCKVAIDEGKNGKKIFRRYKGNKADKAGESMMFRGGCTLIFDLDSLTLRHAIRKPIFNVSQDGRRIRKVDYNQRRIEMQYRCQHGDLVDDLGFAAHNPDINEPFAFIHQTQSDIL